MKFKAVFSASCACLAIISGNANAVILSYGGYTHDTNTDIVTGNGLEWLQWDRTVGYSINSIQSELATIEGGGWSIASNAQMAQLFNSFDFDIAFDDDENTGQMVTTGYTFPDSLAETDELFIAMFGDTRVALGLSYCNIPTAHCIEQSAALFGSDLDEDGLYNVASVLDDWQNNIVGSEQDGNAAMQSDSVANNIVPFSAGIAIVRNTSVDPVPTVAVPIPLGALIGMMSLIGGIAAYQYRKYK